MKRLITRSRSLVLVAALAVVAAMCTVSTANAASSASAAPHEPAVSSAQCNFAETVETCESTDPTVAYYDNAHGDTSDCTFVFNLTWGDSSPTTTVKVTDPTDGSHLLATHRYAATPRAYTITVTVQVTAGNCTGTNSVHTFTLLKPPPPTGPATSNNWSGYVKQGGAKTVKGTWTVPKLNCSLTSDLANAPQWVGLGGNNGNPDLEQTGVFSECIGPIQIDYLVWEILSKGDDLNKAQTPVFSELVLPGDVIDASVTQNADKYNFMVHDHGQGLLHPAWTWKSTQVQKDGSATPPTAEWIVERAGLPGSLLASFGTVTFTGCSYGPELDVNTAIPVVLKGQNGPLTSVSGHGDTIDVKYITGS